MSEFEEILKRFELYEYLTEEEMGEDMLKGYVEREKTYEIYENFFNSKSLYLKEEAEKNNIYNKSSDNFSDLRNIENTEFINNESSNSEIYENDTENNLLNKSNSVNTAFENNRNFSMTQYESKENLFNSIENTFENADNSKKGFEKIFDTYNYNTENSGEKSSIGGISMVVNNNITAGEKDDIEDVINEITRRIAEAVELSAEGIHI